MTAQGPEQTRKVLTDSLKTQPRALLRYGVAVGSVALALLLVLAGKPFFGPMPALLFLLAIIANAWYGLDADADEFIGYAIAGAKRLQQLILDLLTYSEIEMRTRTFSTVDGEAVLTGALGDLRGSIAERAATVTHDPLPLVWGDAAQLQVVFRNLLSNGIKFHHTQPPHVHISATPRGKEWVFSVRDNGIGIAPQDQERIFMVFQRLHHQEPYPKPGVGLAVSKKIIELHGGKIWLESAPGQGATFLFTLPALETSPSPNAHESEQFPTSCARITLSLTPAATQAPVPHLRALRACHLGALLTPCSPQPRQALPLLGRPGTAERASREVVVSHAWFTPPVKQNVLERILDNKKIISLAHLSSL